MPLHLVPVLIDTTKEVSTPVHIEHDSVSLLSRSLPLLLIGLHFNPIGLQLTARSAPLPPCLAANHFDTMGSQLLLYRLCGRCTKLFGNVNLLDFHPRRVRHPLRSEALDIFDAMVRGVSKKLADQVQPFVVGYVRGRLLAVCSPVEILGRSISGLQNQQWPRT